ncbi:hypothetical protein Aru02nite_20400 [Actinocatenispora rupis]|uniref:Uncharacterized protein n=1 Tax=Actinocatenispora rupis TaxID=519421 RepID=A0A8J3N9I9_9ACTN|nr:hypothetical protein Aru02nite_20400 [Actinocatenispora rupis]
MPGDQAQQLTPGVSARSGHGHPYAHIDLPHVYASDCITMRTHLRFPAPPGPVVRTTAGDQARHP